MQLASFRLVLVLSLLLCSDNKGIPEKVIEDAFVESYRLLCSDDKEILNEFLQRVDETLSNTVNK
jgi:hypothetical protein